MFLKDIYKDISDFELNKLKNRKETGSYYTHYAVAYHMIENLLKKKSIKELKKMYYLEPCNGCWIYTFSFIEYLLNRWLDKEAISNILSNNYLVCELQEEVIDKFKLLLQKYYIDNGFNIDTKIRSGSSLTLTLEEVSNIFEDKINWFDIIFWNPPYWFNDKEAKKNIWEKDLPNDIYWLFYIHFKKILNEKWKMSFITPKSFFWIKTFKKVRESIIWKITSIEFCDNNIFYNPYNKTSPWIETVIVNIDNQISTHSDFNIYKTSFKNDKTCLENKVERVLLQKNSKTDCYLLWWIIISDLTRQEIKKITSIKKREVYKVSDLFYSAMWIKTADNKRFIIEKDAKNSYPFYKGTTQSRQEYYPWKQEWYLNLFELKENKLKNTAIPQEKFLELSKIRIWVPEIWHNWQTCAFLYKDSYVSNSIWIYELKEWINEKWLLVLLWLLNSNIYKKLSSCYSSWFRIEKHDIDNLPIPIKEWSKLFDEIYNLVKKFIDSKSENENDIDKLNNNIDFLLRKFCY